MVRRKEARLYREVIRRVYPDVIEPKAVDHDAPAMAMDVDAQKALGVAVKQRREALGLTQEQLALRADLHQRWISNVENGKRNPSYTSIRRLAAGLDCSASTLLADAEVAEASLWRHPE